MSLLPKTKPLPAATGSTIYSKPMVRQAVERVKAGKMGSGNFKALYGGHIREGLNQARGRHSPAHGFHKRTVADYVKTLSKP